IGLVGDRARANGHRPRGCGLGALAEGGCGVCGDQRTLPHGGAVQGGGAGRLADGGGVELAGRARSGARALADGGGAAVVKGAASKTLLPLFQGRARGGIVRRDIGGGITTGPSPRPEGGVVLTGRERIATVHSQTQANGIAEGAELGL